VQIGASGGRWRHLLLASQRLEEGRLRGWTRTCRTGIGLRTFSALESRAVLGVPDAYELPRSPGHGYLKYGTEPLSGSGPVRVGPYQPPLRARVAGPAAAPGAGVHDVDVPVPAQPARPARRRKPAAVRPQTASLLDVLVGRLARLGPPAHPRLAAAACPPRRPSTTCSVRWLPIRSAASPRPTPTCTGRCRFRWRTWTSPWSSAATRCGWRLDAGAGHVAVVGSARSGKSTLLRTLIAGLALTHTPAEARIYCLDFGGGTLAGVGRAATRRRRRRTAGHDGGAPHGRGVRGAAR
jgi:S-DNA-T family DNA segregation ATPase FtsK/SpoIIIE